MCSVSIDSIHCLYVHVYYCIMCRQNNNNFKLELHSASDSFLTTLALYKCSCMYVVCVERLMQNYHDMKTASLWIFLSCTDGLRTVLRIDEWMQVKKTLCLPLLANVKDNLCLSFEIISLVQPPFSCSYTQKLYAWYCPIKACYCCLFSENVVCKFLLVLLITTDVSVFCVRGQ